MKTFKNMMLGLALTASAAVPSVAQNYPRNYPQSDQQNYPRNDQQSYPQNYPGNDQQNYPQNDQHVYQQNSQQPPSFSPGQLDSLVSRVALYPDPLLAQVLAAATFPDQIQDAARWANENRNLRGNELADAIAQSNLPFDPAVQALLPFPNVLDTMARDMNWTSNLGNAFLAERDAVMDAVQRMRRTAQSYGYLQSNNQMRVVSGPSTVEIEPYDPGMVYVPAYDPYVVFAAPRPGFYVGSAIQFGGGCPIGVFGGWGWGGGFNWYNHAVLVNHVAWGRTWYNRNVYVHNYGNWDGGQWRNSSYSRNGFVNRVNVDRSYNTYNRTNTYRNDNNVNTFRGGYNNEQRNSYRQDNNVNQVSNGQRNSYRTENTPNQFRGGYNNEPRSSYRPADNNVNQFRGGSNNAQRNTYRAPQQYSAPATQTFRQSESPRVERSGGGGQIHQGHSEGGFRHERR
jgi:hypothetical protein